MRRSVDELVLLELGPLRFPKQRLVIRLVEDPLTSSRLNSAHGAPKIVNIASL